MPTIVDVLTFMSRINLVSAESADPQNRSEWRGRLRRRLVKQVQPSVEDSGL